MTYSSSHSQTADAALQLESVGEHRAASEDATFVVAQQVVGPLHRLAQGLVTIRPAPAPANSRKRSSRRSRTSCGLIDSIRAAANSIAKAMPSRRRQTLRHSVDVRGPVERERPGGPPGRVRRRASPPVTPPPTSTSRVGTGHECSARMPRASREVAITLTVAARARIVSAIVAAASSTCSQLSITISSRRPDKATARLSLTVIPACAVTPRAVATASGTAAGSPDRGEFHEPHAVGELRREFGGDVQCQPRLADAANSRQRDQPMGVHQVGQFFDLGVTTDEAGCLGGKVARDRVDRLQRWEVRPQPGRPHLEDLQRLGEVAKLASTEIDEVDPVEVLGGRCGEKNLSAVASRHHARRPIQRRVEVVRTLRLDVTGRQTHANGQRQSTLRCDRRVHRIGRRRERRANPVAGVLEQRTLVAPRSPPAAPHRAP